MHSTGTTAAIVRICRSIAAIIVGLMVISLLVELVEFALVSLVSGEVTTDPDRYFQIRNQGWFLAVKLVYNAAGAAAGGFIAGIVAGRAPTRHAVGLAFVQTAAFVFALTQPQIRQTTPEWMWAALIVVSATGIIAGGRLTPPRRRPVTARP